MAQLEESIDVSNDIIDIYTLTFQRPTWLSEYETLVVYHYRSSNLYTFDFKGFYMSFEELVHNYPIYKYNPYRNQNGKFYLYNDNDKYQNNPYSAKLIELWNM